MTCDAGVSMLDDVLLAAEDVARALDSWARFDVEQVGATAVVATVSHVDYTRARDTLRWAAAAFMGPAQRLEDNSPELARLVSALRRAVVESGLTNNPRQNYPSVPEIDARPVRQAINDLARAAIPAPLPVADGERDWCARLSAEDRDLLAKLPPVGTFLDGGAALADAFGVAADNARARYSQLAGHARVIAGRDVLSRVRGSYGRLE